MINLFEIDNLAWYVLGKCFITSKKDFMYKLRAFRL